MIKSQKKLSILRKRPPFAINSMYKAIHDPPKTRFPWCIYRRQRIQLQLKGTMKHYSQLPNITLEMQ